MNNPKRLLDIVNAATTDCVQHFPWLKSSNQKIVIFIVTNLLL